MSLYLTIICINYLQVSQFVKLGKSVADISIELYKRSNQNMNLRRTIFASNDTCHYYVNSILVSKKKVNILKYCIIVLC